MNSGGKDDRAGVEAQVKIMQHPPPPLRLLVTQRATISPSSWKLHNWAPLWMKEFPKQCLDIAVTEQLLELQPIQLG